MATSRGRQVISVLGFAALVLCAFQARASFHLWQIDEVFSDASGTVQFIELTTSASGEQFLSGHGITVMQGASTHTFNFATDLPGDSANRHFLIATQGFANLGLVTPDYVVPDGFLFLPNATINYAGFDIVNYASLPTDGTHSIDRSGNVMVNSPTNFAGQSGSVSPPSTAPDLNQHGLTGSWYQPATSGQGIELEVFPNLIAPGTAYAFGAWFTFDHMTAGGADRQRWYTFDGNGQSGAPNVPITLYQNVGGNFDAPPTTNSTVVGTGTLAFTSCSAGSLAYTFTDGSGRTGTIPLTRLTSNVTCAVGATPATNADFALSGNFYVPATSGQGFVFEVNPLSPIIFFAWYTYAPNGQAAGAAGQRWFTGEATNFTSGMRNATFIVYETTGGLFDQPTPAPQTIPVGMATITFASCTSAQFQYTFTGGSNAGKFGTIPLQRIGPVPPGCVSPPMQGGYPGYPGS